MHVIAETNRHTLIVEVSREEYSQLLTIAEDEWVENFEDGISKLGLPSFHFNPLRAASRIAAYTERVEYRCIFTYNANGLGYSKRFIPFEEWIRTPEKVKNLILAHQIGRKGLKIIQAAIQKYIQETENG